MDLLQEMKKNDDEYRQKGQNYLNGRDTTDLTKEEFDELQRLTDNFYHNHFDPIEKKIIENKENYQKWLLYLNKANDRSKMNHEMDIRLGLNLHYILKDIDYIGNIAQKYALGDPFVSHLISDLTFIHNTRKIEIPLELAKVVARPEEAEISDELMYKCGVVLYGQYAYDLNMDVTLDKREYGNIHQKNAFSLFFALKLSQIDMMEVKEFLEYQLTETFNNDIIEFKSFLIPLLLKYRNFEFDEGVKEIIEPDIISLVKDWIASKSINNQMVTDVNFEDTTENYKRINGKLTDDEVLYILSFLWKETGNDKDGETFLQESEVKELLKFGFAYPKNKRSSPFHLNTSTKRTVKTIYYCFYRLYMALNKDFIDKDDIVYFLINNFDNFSIDNYKTIYDNIKNVKPPKMKFDIQKDYIDKAKQIKLK